jgi:hypothetical protein
MGLDFFSLLTVLCVHLKRSAISSGVWQGAILSPAIFVSFEAVRVFVH